jgi:hypothetical protein
MPKLVYHDSSGAAGTVEMGTQTILIGRAVECQIQTQDALVSRKHARVTYDGLYWIEDLGSSNGVYVGTERVQRQQLRPGDTFRCGNLEVRFEAEVNRRTGMAAAPVVPALVATVAPAPGPGPLAVAGQAASPAALPVPPPAGLPVAPAGLPVVGSATAAAPEAPGRTGASAAEAVLVGELESERRRRTDLEFELSEARRQIAELSARPPAAAAAGDGDSERLRRRVEQLESELRRKGGVISGTSTSGADAALRATEAERDRLRARVTELEAQLAAGPPKNDDHEMDLLRLRRRVEQLESELRRLRGGKAPQAEPSSADTLVADLEEQLRRLKEERDEALRRAAGSASSDAKLVEDLDRARRRIEQLESELKRRPVGTVSEGNRLESLRQELEAALRQLRDTERERDGLREAVAKGGSAAARPAPKAVENLTAVSDGLADIRAALRAAGDELALEQLEQVRGALRQACTLLNITL